MLTKSIYIHIPFCIQKCNYCSFVSFGMNEQKVDLYFEALFKEIEFNLVNKPIIETLYIGGGTPSLIKIAHYKELFDLINQHGDFSKNVEITIEINPATVDKSYLFELKALGFNRISIGVQSFDDKILSVLNRKHNSQQAIDSIKMSKEAGFKNISIDLIYGLPQQNMQIWNDSINKALEQNVEHISSYGLKIEEGTPFGSKLPARLPDEDMCADMYTYMIDKLSQSGFTQYEISNFAVSGFESKHNTAYWKNNSYYGFGIAAHGYVNGIRYSNTCDFDNYIKNHAAKETVHYVTQQERIEEALFLGLRMANGIDTVEFKKLYNIELMKKYEKTINKYLREGFMSFENGFLKLTTQGFIISNIILADFIGD